VGIVLDSSVIIVAERRGHTVREILEQVKAVQGEIEIGVSLVNSYGGSETIRPAKCATIKKSNSG